MKTVEAGNLTLTLYASIKELPIEVSKKFHSYILQDLGIGNTIEAVDNHLSKLMTFAGAGRKEETTEEAKNLRFNLFSMLSQWSYPCLSFACLIHSVNGIPHTDRTTEGLNALIQRLSDAGMTIGDIEEYTEEIKKKWIQNESSTSLNGSEKI